MSAKQFGGRTIEELRDSAEYLSEWHEADSDHAGPVTRMEVGKAVSALSDLLDAAEALAKLQAAKPWLTADAATVGMLVAMGHFIGRIEQVNLPTLVVRWYDGLTGTPTFGLPENEPGRAELLIDVSAKEFAQAIMRAADRALVERDALAASRRETAEARNVVAWVIERHMDNDLHYWTGRPHTHGGVWSTAHADALRFSRRDDAAAMLTWHCGGIGRVVEHMWIGK